MELSSYFNPEQLHHAYLCVGSLHEIGDSLYDFFTHNSVWAEKGYSVERFSYARMNIEDAQMVRSSIGINRDVKRIVIIEASFVNHEAQQSLLKTIEEPSLGTCFIWCVPRATTLLPTIRSRCYEIFFQSDAEKHNDTRVSLDNPAHFARASYEERYAWIRSETEEWESEQVLEFITGISEWVHSSIAERNHDGNDLSDFSEVARCLQTAYTYIQSPSANHRMLLESIAFALPIKKV